MEREFAFRDPHKRQNIVMRTVPADRLAVIEHQRKVRPSHVANLIDSVERMGFIVPLVVVEDESHGSSRYVVIDGQHRLEAARAVGIRSLPVLVVPESMAPLMMNLNVEKDLNIREKSVVALGIYRAQLARDDDIKENDPQLSDAIERAYYVTLGLAYEGPGRLAGSAFEPLLKKCDHFMRRNLSAAFQVRAERAERILETNSLVREVTSTAKEMGVFHQYFQYQLISHIDPFKRKRGRQNFDELFDRATAKLEKMIAEPDGIRRLGGG